MNICEENTLAPLESDCDVENAPLVQSFDYELIDQVKPYVFEPHPLWSKIKENENVPKLQEHTPLIQLNTIGCEDTEHNEEDTYKPPENGPIFENVVEQNTTLHDINEQNDTTIIECYDGQLMNSCISNNGVDWDFIREIMDETKNNDLNCNHNSDIINNFETHETRLVSYITPEREINTNFDESQREHISLAEKHIASRL